MRFIHSSLLVLVSILALIGCRAAASPAALPAPTALSESTAPPAAPSPHPTPPTPTVPAGFHLTVISEQPKIGTALLRQGQYFYVTELQTGNVIRLTDSDGDGELDQSLVVASGFSMPRALAFEPKTGDLFVSSRGQVNALRDTDGDGVADINRLVVKDLFDLDYMHSNNGIAFGPDNKLYIADGAPRLLRLAKKGAAAMPPDAGTILTVNPDGSNLQVYAHGFRNPFGLVFAADGSLYATDNGEDSLKQPFQGDELNLIHKDGDYGYPNVFGDPPPGSSTVAPLVSFPADSAPTAVLPYDAAQFPPEYRGNVFVGLWNIGHKIVRAWQGSDGKWLSEDFITGLIGPVGMTLGADGSIYILDMSDSVAGTPGTGSRIYHLTYQP